MGVDNWLGHSIRTTMPTAPSSVSSLSSVKSIEVPRVINGRRFHLSGNACVSMLVAGRTGD
jgi:hypothetical protein